MRNGLARDARYETSEPCACAVGQAQYVDGRLDCTRGDVDHASELARDHAVHRGFDELNGRQHVGLERGDPHVVREFAEISRGRTPGVIDQNVRIRTRGQRLLAPGFSSDVDRDRSYFDAGGFSDFVRGTFQRLTPAREYGHIDTFARERKRASLAEPLARRANQRGLAFQAEIHGRLLSSRSLKWK